MKQKLRFVLIEGVRPSELAVTCSAVGIEGLDEGRPALEKILTDLGLLRLDRRAEFNR